MGKLILSKGNAVIAKKWSGEEFIGLFEHTYKDGTHCVLDVKTNKRFNIKAKDIKLATEDEAKEAKRLAKKNNAVVRDNVGEKIVKHKENNESEELKLALASTEETEE